jgi:hypothetical protein
MLYDCVHTMVVISGLIDFKKYIPTEKFTSVLCKKNQIPVFEELLD